MQTWMIVLLVVSGVILLAAIAVLAVMLASVHSVLGHRTGSAERTMSGFDLKYGTDYDWFDRVKPNMQGFSINAYDGIKLSAVLVKNPAESGNVAICCHGYGVSYKSVQAQAQLFYDRGFDVLFPTMRGHGSSEGKVGMAWLDRFDILRWVDMVIEKYGKTVKIALVGVSMGGAAVVGAAGMGLPSQVKCVVNDCGFSSQAEEYAAKIIKFGVFLRGFKFWLYSIGVRLVHGYSVLDADFVPLARNMTVPALFIHGADDTAVPQEQGQKLFDACGSAYKKQLTVQGAGHALAYATDCTAYCGAVDALIDKCFADAPARPEGLLPLDAEKARIEEERLKRAEEERLAAEKAEQERLEQERIAAEKAEQERLEQERIAAEKAEQERLEQERIAAEKAEQERLEAEQAEKKQDEGADSSENVVNAENTEQGENVDNAEQPESAEQAGKAPAENDEQVESVAPAETEQAKADESENTENVESNSDNE